MRGVRHLLSAALALTLIWSCVEAPASAHAPAPKVAVTIFDEGVWLSRTSSGLGTVIFDVINRGGRRHTFRIDGKATTALLPGHNAVLRVVFTQPGTYRYRVPGLRSGAVRVTGSAIATPTTATSTATVPASTVAAGRCANPTASTVTVTMSDAPAPRGYSFSSSSILCGSVSFVLKDVGSAPHGLQLMDPMGTILSASQTVEPDQTITVVSNLKYTGTYEWVDSVFTDSFGEAEPGLLTIQ